MSFSYLLLPIFCSYFLFSIFYFLFSIFYFLFSIFFFKINHPLLPTQALRHPGKQVSWYSGAFDTETATTP